MSFSFKTPHVIIYLMRSYVYSSSIARVTQQPGLVSHKRHWFQSHITMSVLESENALTDQSVSPLKYKNEKYI